MHPAIVFDDAHPRLAPLTDLRAVFDVRTGALTTLERLQRQLKLKIVGLSVPSGLADLTRERHSCTVNALAAGTSGPVLIVNGRCVSLAASVKTDRAFVQLRTEEFVAGWLPADEAAKLIGDPAALAARTLAAAQERESVAALLLERPWHVRSFRDIALLRDTGLLALDRGASNPLVLPGVTLIGAPGRASIHPSANVAPSVVLDVQWGPIVIDHDAVVRPGAIIVGPAYIGPHTTVMERALIKGQTAIGPWCKIAGEVGGTIFQGFANKAHDGHLGDSYVGEWANLGAGTTNSNLLNTYSEITARAASDAPNERTGETFLGAIIGDHAKFAICTRIMAGSVVHTGSMWAAAAPVAGPVDAFSWVTDQGRRRYRLDKFIEVARAVMARRKVEPSEAYVCRLGELHAAGDSA